MDFEEVDTYLYLKVSDNDSLQESIAERIEDAVSKIKYNDNYIEIELKFGRIISNKTENKRIQFDDDNDESFIVQAKNFDYFDSNIGRRHWRKINNYVRNDFGSDYNFDENQTKDSIYNARLGRTIVTHDYFNPGETCHTKKRIDDIFIHNPYGEFDFRITISEKVFRGKRAKRTAKRKGTLVLTREKETNVWCDSPNGTEFKSSTVIDSSVDEPNRYEFEIELDIESVVDDIRDREDPYYYDIEEFINNLILEADSINDEIS